MEKDYNKIIQMLRNTEPMPPHPQQLTRTIMENIQSMEGKHRWNDLPDVYWNMFVRIRTAVAVAACFLLLVFLSQQIHLQKSDHVRDQAGIPVRVTMRQDYTRILMEQLPKEEICSDMSPLALFRAYDRARNQLQTRKEEWIKSYLK